ncbi:MAG: hypothetical protein HOH58_05755 [Opitutaceae bacterium]|nr:hypothetical protein [Opitutaceae bacterium]
MSALSVLSPAACAGSKSRDGKSNMRGVMFDREELPRIRESLKHPAFAHYWESSRNADLAADLRFLTVEVDTMNRVRDLARVANIAFRSAFVHVIEPSEDQRVLAELAVATALKFNRWDWILEDGVHTVGVMRGPMVGVLLSCALDWLGEDVDPKLRDGVMQRLGDEIGPASYRAVHGELGASPMPRWTMDLDSTGLTIVDVSQWPKILADTNLQIIATSGLLISASMLPDHPDATKWRELAERSLREFVAKQPEDGSFDEGSAYWGFTYNYFCLCLEFLRRFHGVDERGITDFPAMARYFLRSTMPTHETPRDTLSIGDCSNSGSVIALAWIGREFRDSTAQHLLTRPGMVTTEPTLCWGAIWFDPTVPTDFAADMKHDYTLAPGLVVSRTGWSDQDAVLCLRSGEPCNHEHADRNSLLFAAYGERLFNDPIKASYDPKAPGWLLRQTEAHTSVLIDGGGHIYHHGEEGTNSSLAHAHIVAHQVGLSWMTTTSDATEAYRLAGHPVSRVARTVVYLKPDVVIVFDAIDLVKSLPVEVRFQAHNRDGKGSVVADADGFVIKRPQANLQAVCGGGRPLTISSGKLDLPVDTGVYPYASVVASAAREHRILTVGSAHPKSKTAADLSWEHDEGGWTVSGQRDGVSFRVHLAEREGAAAPAVVCDLPSRANVG